MYSRKAAIFIFTIVVSFFLHHPLQLLNLLDSFISKIALLIGYGLGYSFFIYLIALQVAIEILEGK